ncbi:unnamed protein product [Euphydryas editha]|uniref:HTH psq-type domain-containing protein n=1 Tax=Euphydryas editha TaxID=104508 RepID=A0AAU9UVQ1_EUPED|nr:unnamed protein product [Euphydryas editha]
MPRNYSRTTTRQNWDVEQLKKAIMSVSEGSFGYLKTSQVYGVPKSTLQDRVTKYHIITSNMPSIIPTTPSSSRPVNSNYLVSPSDKICLCLK